MQENLEEVMKWALSLSCWKCAEIHEVLYKRKQTHKTSLHSWLSSATDGQSSLPYDIQVLISDIRPSEDTIKLDTCCI